MIKFEKSGSFEKKKLLLQHENSKLRIMTAKYEQPLPVSHFQKNSHYVIIP